MPATAARPAVDRTRLGGLRVPATLNRATGRELATGIMSTCRRQPTRTLVLDLSLVTAIDGAGVAALVQCRRRASVHRTTLLLQRPSPAVTEALTRARLLNCFGLDPNASALPDGE